MSSMAASPFISDILKRMEQQLAHGLPWLNAEALPKLVKKVQKKDQKDQKDQNHKMDVLIQEMTSVRRRCNNLSIRYQQGR